MPNNFIIDGHGELGVKWRLESYMYVNEHTYVHRHSFKALEAECVYVHVYRGSKKHILFHI